MKLLERQSKTNTAAGIVAQAVVCLLCKCEPEFKPQSQQKGKKKKIPKTISVCSLLKVFFFLIKSLFLFFFFYSYMHTMFGSFLPIPPLLPPLLPCYQAETILPLSLILLERV
jgi:hypothetical protein